MKLRDLQKFLKILPCNLHLVVVLKNIIFSNVCPIYLHSTMYNAGIQEIIPQSRISGQIKIIVIIFRLVGQRLPVGLLNSLPCKNFELEVFCHNDYSCIAPTNRAENLRNFCSRCVNAQQISFLRKRSIAIFSKVITEQKRIAKKSAYQSHHVNTS